MKKRDSETEVLRQVVATQGRILKQLSAAVLHHENDLKKLAEVVANLLEGRATRQLSRN